MGTILIPGKRMFVAGQLVELWEDPEMGFGWGREDLERYADREEWVLLFNAMMLSVPCPEIGAAS